MIVSTLKANSIEQLNEKLKQATEPDTLIFAFASSDIDHFALYELLTQKKYTAVTSSSGGQFIEADLLAEGIVCMILVLPANSFKIKRYDFKHDFFEAGKTLAQFADTAFYESDVLLFGNSYSDIDHEALLDGFHKGNNSKIGVFGGLASNNQAGSDNYIGIEGVVSHRAIGVVVFDKSKIKLQGLVVGGWEPIGTNKTVTKSSGKKVYELDKRPINEVYHEYFNHKDDSSAAQYLAYPIQHSSFDGGKIIRLISDIDDDAFHFSGHIPEGTKIYFCSPSMVKTVRSSINEINDFQRNNKLMDSDAVMVFSCSARLQSFGSYISNEVRSFHEMWGNKYCGFFSHGEVGCCDQGAFDAKLHNSSISIVIFKDLTTPTSFSENTKDIIYHEEKLEVADIIEKDAMILKLQEQKLSLSALLQRTSVDLNNALSELDKYKKGLESQLETQIKDIDKLNNEIVDTQKEVLFAMGKVAENRANELGNHVKRVAEYAKAFALLLGLGKDKAELIKQASPMHDIGKVGVPDAILQKHDELSSEEFTQIKRHAELGYSMLNHSTRPILEVAATIAHEHHEKWDGTGYPRGLTGKNIHLYGRIIAIADVFDALGSDRAYKDAWEDERIWDYLRAEKGKQFDPELIDLFFENIDIFKTIRSNYSDL